MCSGWRTAFPYHFPTKSVALISPPRSSFICLLPEIPTGNNRYACSTPPFPLSLYAYTTLPFSPSPHMLVPRRPSLPPCRRYLPNFLVPGPLCYMEGADMFVTCSASFELEAYRFSVLAAAGGERQAGDASANGEEGAKGDEPSLFDCQRSLLCVGCGVWAAGREMQVGEAGMRSSALLRSKDGCHMATS